MRAELVQFSCTKDVLLEVKHLLKLMYPDMKFHRFESVFHDIVNLFNGNYPGYRACNTPFHDLNHTLDCLVAMIRIIHGAYIEDVKLEPDNIELGLISALMHDTGYIQADADSTGSGAKYTLVHVQRSIDFLQEYFGKNGYNHSDFIICSHCIRYTGTGGEPDTEFQNIEFPSLLGQMLGTADLVGQIADECYLEKLPFLAKEFKEGGVSDYESEEDLLLKTSDFYQVSKIRLCEEFGNVVLFLKSHFRERWGVDRNLYVEAMEDHINYLDHILKTFPNGDYDKYLKRKSIDRLTLKD